MTPQANSRLAGTMDALPGKLRLDLTEHRTHRADQEDASLLKPGPRSKAMPAKRPWPLLLVACDAVSLVASFSVGAVLRLPLGSREGPTSIATSLAHEVAYLPVFIVALAGYGLYYRHKRRLFATSFPDMGALVHAIALGSILSLGMSALMHRWAGTPKLGWVEVLLMGGPALVLVPALRSGAALSLRSRGVVRSRLVVVGSGVVANSLARRLQRCPDIEVVGFVDDTPLAAPPCPYLGAIVDLPAVCEREGADRVLVAFSSASQEQLIEVLRRLPAKMSISVVPRLFELVTWQSQVEELHGLTVMDVAPRRLGPLSRATKRSVDLVVSSSLLLCLAPIMAMIATAIKLTSPGPVFFRQPRVGCAGQIFRIFKFRTMVIDADDVKIDLRQDSDADGPLFKLRSDPRVTSVGRFLRCTSLDEIPQLLNVLRGQMALVGPRPFVPDESTEINGWAARRFDVRPGMTGLWQISFNELRQLDYAYVASWSLWWDLKILWLTPGSVLRRHGAY